MNKILFLLATLLLAGCATKPAPVEFPVSPKMATTFCEGETTITWKAAAGQNYTIFYTDAPAGKLPGWKPLPQGTGVRGEGKQTTITDRTAPDATPRRYLLLTGDQKPF
ncbi:MAG: hypothetical protein IT583_04150 [Verrucomicrobia bacterium]|nr:hypothetical protein [Verrucomicrobiota bacterium]